MKGSKQEIKGIVFDIGGILTDSKKEVVREELALKYNIDPARLLEIIIKYHKELLIGKISQDYLLDKIKETFNIDKRSFLSDWQRLLEKHFIVNDDVKRLIKDLSKKYIIASLSNVTPLFEKVRQKKGVYDSFTINLSSFKEGLAKPDEKFYTLLIDRIKISPEEMIFIDDKEKNLLPAKKLGMKTILYNNNSQLINDLKILGVEI